MTQIVLEHQVAVPSIQGGDSIEINSAEDKDFNPLYRLWSSWNLLGTFYKDLQGYWVAQPCLIN